MINAAAPQAPWQASSGATTHWDGVICIASTSPRHPATLRGPPANSCSTERTSTADTRRPMSRLREFRSDVAALLRLAIPIASIQVGYMLMGVVETIIVGRVSAAALAAVALGNIYFFTGIAFGMGVLFALDPLVSQALGAGDDAQVTRSLQRALVLAISLAIVASALFLPAESVLRLLGQPAEVVPLAGKFVRISIPGVLAFYLFVTLRQTLQAMRRVAPIIVTMVAANLLNAVLCAVLALGLFGAPRLGVTGAAIAGTVSRWFMTILLAALTIRDLGHHLWPPRHDVLDRRALARMLAIGVPIGSQILLEFGVFAVVGVIMGRFGMIPVAAHQVALNIASLTFMVPLGVSSAATVFVGHAIGRGDVPTARRASAAALAIAVGYMCCTAATFIGIPRVLAAIYTPDLAVQALAIVLLPIAGVFQVFDGVQVVCIGLLRGLGDTRAPLWINIFAFWGIGFPVSLLLGFTAGLGPRGLWWGLVVGLIGVALLLLVRLRGRLRGQIERLVVDAPSGPLAETPRSSV